MERINNIIGYLSRNDLYPDLKKIKGGADPEVIIDGKKVLMFSSNNYLGLATRPELKQAAIEAIERYGVGSDGSRMLSGNLDVHREFEKKIAEFKEGEDAIMWPSGYQANVGVISAFTNPPKIGPSDFVKKKTIIFSDELNHASIIDGCIMSGQEKVVYRHNDVEDLEKKLKKYKNRRKLVVTDGVFSMDGDIAPLDKIVELCKKYDAYSMIDDAHSTGILGEKGRGTCEHFGLKPIKDVDIILGTCSKALASTGGFVVGSKELIKFLRVASRPYIFSTATTPASSASLIVALKVIQEQPEIRQRLKDNSKYLRDRFEEIGFNTLKSETQIIPILIGADEDAIKFTRKLFENNIYGPCVRWPAVEHDKARIRFAVMATHTREHIDTLINSCEIIGKKLNLIK